MSRAYANFLWIVPVIEVIGVNQLKDDVIVGENSFFGDLTSFDLEECKGRCQSNDYGN